MHNNTKSLSWKVESINGRLKLCVREALSSVFLRKMKLSFSQIPSQNEEFLLAYASFVSKTNGTAAGMPFIFTSLLFYSP